MTAVVPFCRPLADLEMFFHRLSGPVDTRPLDHGVVAVVFPGQTPRAVVADLLSPDDRRRVFAWLIVQSFHDTRFWRDGGTLDANALTQAFAGRTRGLLRVLYTLKT